MNRRLSVKLGGQGAQSQRAAHPLQARGMAGPPLFLRREAPVRQSVRT